jgi:TetR/AcrR family transcriptional regulator, transcriptional repressor for nem operon
MPWAKDFDEELAVDRAMATFWVKGYEATSVQDLATAMQINKSSLYNAFGSKKELFTRALLKYDCETRRKTLADLRDLPSPVEAIYGLFDAMLDAGSVDPQKRGCLLVNTAGELHLHSGETQAFVTAGLLDIERFFVEMIDRAKANGEVSVGIEATDTATWLLSQFVGWRVLCRGAFDAQALQFARAITRKQLALLLRSP